MNVGDTVDYFDLTYGTVKRGTVTSLDVTVMHVWHYHLEDGTVMESHRAGRPCPDAYHPKGVEINGEITRTLSAVKKVES